jgi:hypothetical protein
MEISAENMAKIADSLIDLAANIAVMRKILCDAGIVNNALYDKLLQEQRQEMLRGYQNQG